MENEDLPSNDPLNTVENAEKGEEMVHGSDSLVDMEKKVLGGLFQINPVTKTGQRLYMVGRQAKTKS